MPAIKARKITASNMTTPVNVEQRRLVNGSYTWVTVARDMFCEFQSKIAFNVNTGLMTIGAARHMIYSRFQEGLLPGMRLYNYVAGTYLYLQSVIDVEQIHQWMEITAVEAIFDSSMAAVDSSGNGTGAGVSILRPQEGKGAWGQYTENTTTVATNVPVIFAEPNANALAAIADRIATLTYWGVGVPIDTNVKEGDILVTGDGQKFRVHAVRIPMSFAPLTTLMVGAFQ